MTMGSAPESPRSVVRVIYGHQGGRAALVRIDNTAKLGALDQDGYFALAQAMREVAARPEVIVTVLTGTGRFFSAGADVTMATRTSSSSLSPTSDPSYDSRDEVPDFKQLQSTFGASNLFVTRAFYSHPKVLVAALNGPVIGLSAALIAHADLIYCTPQTFLLTPFASLALVAEGVASRAFVARMGVAKANEALLMGRRIGSEELLRCGFVNGVFDPAAEAETAEPREQGTWRDGDDEKFLARVMREVDDRLGPHLAGDSLLEIKKLMRRPEMEVLDAQNAAEVFAGIDRFMTGMPQEEFRKLATGEKRHKL